MTTFHLDIYHQYWWGLITRIRTSAPFLPHSRFSPVFRELRSDSNSDTLPTVFTQHRVTPPLIRP